MTMSLFDEVAEVPPQTWEPPPADVIAIEFIGIPHPQGSKSGVWNPKLGRVMMLEGKSDSGRMKHEAWRSAVAMGCRQYLAANPRPPLDEPVALVIEFRFPLPAGDVHRTRHSTKPDLDKIVRSTLDALVLGGLLKDDAKVCALVAAKRYARGDETAGASLTVDVLGALEQFDREQSKQRAKEARRR